MIIRNFDDNAKVLIGIGLPFWIQWILLSPFGLFR